MTQAASMLGSAAGSAPLTPGSSFGMRKGHHARPPRSWTSAGTSTVRTTSVSSNTPKATAEPISAKMTSGSTPKTENVAPSTIPADVMTEPVELSPSRDLALS